MSKYSVGFKIKLVQEYLVNKFGSGNMIAQRHSIPITLLRIGLIGIKLTELKN